MKNYLIVGASSGIGKVLAESLAKQKHLVYGTYFCSDVRHLSSEVNYYNLDVRSDTLDFDFLPKVVDGFVYCPGNILLKPFHRLKPDEYRKDLELQLIGAIKCIQAVLPRLKKADTASIVLFSTVAVLKGYRYHTAVAVSKGAIEGLIRSLAAEFAPGIRVNGIAPSITETQLTASLLNSEAKREANGRLHPLNRIGHPVDLASAAEFLLTEKSDWITGQILHVDGGISTLNK